MVLPHANSEPIEGSTTICPLYEDISCLPLDEVGSEMAIRAKRIGVEPKQVHLRAMKNKCASCSSKGRLTFDPELLKKPAAFRAEVIVHELLHLKIPNHGPLFKAVLRFYLARYGSYKLSTF